MERSLGLVLPIAFIQGIDPRNILLPVMLERLAGLLNLWKTVANSIWSEIKHQVLAQGLLEAGRIAGSVKVPNQAPGEQVPAALICLSDPAM